MPIKVNWDDLTGRQIIHFHQTGYWSWEEYDTGVDKTITMMDSVKQPVTILIHLDEPLTQNRTAEGFRHFMDAMKRWQEHKNYGQFWMVLKPNYWEHLALWIVSQVYNPYDMVVAKTMEDARRKGERLLKKQRAKKTDEVSETP
jgi:hypothetical protein